jgi:type I restriction enzyme M protein
MASPHDAEVLLAREFTVLRVVKADNRYGVDPYYLLYLLSHQFTQAQIEQKVFIDTTLPNIADRWQELLLPIFANPEERHRTSERIKSVLDAKWRALDAIQQLRQEFGGITT